MTRQIVYVVPTDQIDRCKEQLDQMWGYLSTMRTKGMVLDPHGENLLEYLAKARACLQNLHFEGREVI